MRNAVLADTGPLYAALDPDDTHHVRAHAELEVLSDAGMGVVVAYPTAFEAYTLVLQRLGVPTAHRFVRELRAGAALVTPDVDDHQMAVALVARYVDEAITLFDGLAVVLASRLDLAVWTYDSDFDVMGSAVWRG